MPNVYKSHEAGWSEVIKKINVNVLFTSSDLPPVKDVGFVGQNKMLFKTSN